MVNQNMRLGEIALVDPKLAFTLLKAGRVSDAGYVSIGGWEIFDVKATFGDENADPANPPTETIPPNTLAKSKLVQAIKADFWVQKVTYTVRRPFAFSDNIFKPSSDYFNAQNPNINFQLIINSYARYAISDDFMPLENISMAFEATAPAGIIMRYSASVQANFINTRPLYGLSDTGCTPYCIGVLPDMLVWPTQPAIGGTMTVKLNSAPPANIIGKTFYISNVGVYKVLSIEPDGIHIVLQLLSIPPGGIASGDPIGTGFTSVLCGFWLDCPLILPRAGENPTEVIISLHGIRLPSQVYGSCSQEEALDLLKKKGFMPEEPSIRQLRV